VTQFHGLNALQSRHGADGLQVLGVPCNQFYLQEPAWDGRELMDGLKYIRPGAGFVPNFPLTWKVDVNGAQEHGMYTYMKSLCPNVYRKIYTPTLYSPIYTEDVRWNYEKFLIGPDGYPLYRYAQTQDPGSDPQMQQDIATELAKLKGAASPVGVVG